MLQVTDTTARRDARLEEQVRREFSARARKSSPRAVVMADLARDLGISTKTLYRLFPSKADLMRRLLERWAGRFEQDLVAGAGSSDELPFAEQLLRTSDV